LAQRPGLFSVTREPVRAKAETISDPECRRLMLDVASKWDEFARRAEELRGKIERGSKH
jgi:hypothetical protein